MTKYGLLLFSVMITGCSTVFSGSPERPVDIQQELASINFAFDATEITKYRTSTGVEKRALRDEITDARIRAYDIKFGEFEEELYSFGIGSGIGTDWTLLTISALTAVVGGAQTKAAFGAANTAIVGAKGSIDKQLLLEKTTPALIAEMESQRSKVLLDIRKGLSQDVTTYNLFRALSDLERYRRAGSLSGGLNGIVKSAGEEIAANEKEISSIIQVTYLADDAGEKIEKFWLPDGKNINTDNQAKIMSCMAQNGLSTSGSGKIATFIINAEFKELREKVVDCIN